MNVQRNNSSNYFLQLNNLYQLYGYETKSYGSVIAYEYKRGRYFGVDLFSNGDDESNVERIKSMYQNQSFSVSLKESSPLEDIENDLFNDFFQIPGNISFQNHQFDPDTLHKLPKARYSPYESYYTVL